MERERVWLRAEWGAAVATAALTLAAGLVVLFAPLVSYCAVRVSFAKSCPTQMVRTESLLAAHTGGDVWALLAGMLLVLLAGAGGAALDARWRPEMRPLAVATGIAVLGFLVIATTVLGLLFLPPVLGVAFACFAAIQRRRLARARTLASHASTSASPEHEMSASGSGDRV